ncbi:MAG: molybdopterin molybdenumtransferase MoeA, partial [Aeromicrobium sp.]|nr:molybdopterin molybdenumtransferase MoeA [Aeromicrobium sp.]
MLPIESDAPTDAPTNDPGAEPLPGTSLGSSAADEEATQPVPVSAPTGASPTGAAPTDPAPTEPPTAPQPAASQPEPSVSPAVRPTSTPRPRPASIREGLLTVEDHLEKILRGIGPLTAYDQPLVESLGLPLHEPFVSALDLPLFDNSSMDGYAVRAEDLVSATAEQPVTLPVVGEIQAGSA